MIKIYNRSETENYGLKKSNKKEFKSLFSDICRLMNLGKAFIDFQIILFKNYSILK